MLQGGISANAYLPERVSRKTNILSPDSTLCTITISFYIPPRDSRAVQAVDNLIIDYWSNVSRTNCTL